MKLEKYWQREFEFKADSLLTDHEAADWTEYSLDKRMNTCVGYLNKYLRPGIFVFDAGSGPGAYLNVMRNVGFKVCGIDFSYKMVNRTRLNYGIKNVWVSSTYDIAAKNEIFDAVIVMGVFQYLSNQMFAISELYRCLKKDGLLILNTLNKKMIVKNHKIKNKLIYTDPFVLKSDFEKAGFKAFFKPIKRLFVKSKETDRLKPDA